MTRCTARGSAAARPTCSHSWTTIPARSSGTAGDSPRTPSASPPRCARRWRRAGFLNTSTSTTDRRSSTPGCCGPARNSASSWSTPHRAGRRAAGKIERFFRTVNSEFVVEIAAGDGEARTAGRRPGRDEPAVHRLGRDRLPPTGTLQRDRPGAAGTLARRRPLPGSRAGRPGRGVPLVRAPHGLQDRPRLAARQPLPGRPRAGRAEGRARLRPVRPDLPAGPPRRNRRGHGAAVPDHPPLPSQGPAGGPGGAARAGHRHRLPRPDRRHPHRRARREGQLRRARPGPARAATAQTGPAAPPTRHDPDGDDLPGAHR